MTTTTEQTLDFKGLSTYKVQTLIDTYLSDLAWKKREYDRQEANKARNVLRLKHLNAVKKAGLSVETETAWRNKDCSLSRDTDENGWFELNLKGDDTTKLQLFMKVKDSGILETEERVVFRSFLNDYIRSHFIRLKQTTTEGEQGA
jgi:hypothetical protein